MNESKLKIALAKLMIEYDDFVGDRYSQEVSNKEFANITGLTIEEVESILDYFYNN